jgi:hypothetical protein
MQIKSHIWAFILTLVVVSSAHANQTPSKDVEKLTRDVDHLVHITEQANWHIDAEELAALQTDILLVICPASRALRERTHAVLKTRSAEHGDLKALYKKADQDLSEISVPLRHHRALLLYESGLARAEKDCPFWMPHKTVYVEQHRPTDQVLLGFDGGGMFNVMPFGTPLRFGFGGSSRLSFGYGVSERFILRMGFEFGGAGLLDKDVEVAEVETQFYAGVPIALRYLWDIWFIEGDLGPIAMGLPWKQEPDYGSRFSTMFGFSSAKVSKVQPWAGLRFSTDYLPANGLSDGFIFRSGFRFGIDYRGM